MDQQVSGVCLCGCGREVSAGRQWIRGHASRGEGGFRGGGGGPVPLPGPDDPSWAEDVGIIDVDHPSGTGDPLSGGPGDTAQSPGPPTEPPADEPPAHARRDWHAKAPKTARAKAPRITAGVRSDITAKLDFMLEIPGRIWEARDPLCGGTFVAQRPEISRSLAEIVCRSPQLVEWFTGTGGGFIMFLDLGAALFPVLQAVMAHHVYHSIEEGPQPNPSDLSQYAA